MPLAGQEDEMGLFSSSPIVRLFYKGKDDMTFLVLDPLTQKYLATEGFRLNGMATIKRRPDTRNRVR
jgi:hypothetical protein